jgi:hypothetical protein
MIVRGENVVAIHPQVRAKLMLRRCLNPQMGRVENAQNAIQVIRFSDGFPS